MNLRKIIYGIVNKICKAVKPEHRYKNSKVNYFAEVPREHREKYKYLLYPKKDCEWCEGEGYEYVDAGELSGYDYRDVCRCMKRHKKFQERIKTIIFKDTVQNAVDHIDIKINVEK